MTRTKIDLKNPVLKNGVHYMTSDYKSRNKDRSTHSGIDLIGKNYAADYIIAMASGVVSDVGYSKSGSGYYVYIKTGDYLVMYCHMKKDSVVVKKNQKVNKGDIIGYMGKSGNATGVHLHITIKYKNNIIDPLPYLQGKSFDEKTVKYVYNCDNLNVRSGPSTKYKFVNDLPCNTCVTVLEDKNGWTKIGDNQYVSSNYLTTKKPSKVYETKKVKTSDLNVRYGPSTKYQKWTEKSPLPVNTIVTYVKKDGWIKISLTKNRWVSPNYLE